MLAKSKVIVTPLCIDVVSFHGTNHLQSILLVISLAPKIALLCFHDFFEKSVRGVPMVPDSHFVGTN